jgi:prefoldin subunit 5
MKHSEPVGAAKDFLETVRTLEETTKKLERTSDALYQEVGNTRRDTQDVRQIFKAAGERSQREKQNRRTRKR